MKHQHDAAGVGFLKIPENVLRIYKHPNYVRKQILIGYKCCITLLSSLTLDFLLELAWNYILKRFVNFMQVKKIQQSKIFLIRFSIEIKL